MLAQVAPPLRPVLIVVLAAGLCSTPVLVTAGLDFEPASGGPIVDAELNWGPAGGALVAKSGRYLVASESMPDPTFRGARILLLTHDGTGTLGLMLNTTARSPWQAHDADAPPVFRCGPVDEDTLLAVHAHAQDVPEAVQLNADYAVSRLDLALTVLEESEAPEGLRLCSGYAGWAPGQLENEIFDGFWEVVTTLP